MDPGARPNPYRAALSRSIYDISRLEEVAEAISVATEHERCIYVERMARGWRWSLAHRGGPYPLLRIAARFLQIDHHRLLITFRTLNDGVAILCRNPKRPSRPRAWAMVDFAGPTAAADVKAHILTTVGN